MSTEPTVNSEVGPWGLVPVWVLTYNLSGAELATYIALRSFSGSRLGAADPKAVFPRVRIIAERANVTQRTAEKAISKLRKLGLIVSTRRHDANGYVKGCDYMLADLDPRPIVSLTVRTDGALTVETDGPKPSKRTEQEETHEGDALEGTTSSSRSTPVGAHAHAHAALKGAHLQGLGPKEQTRRIIAMWTVVLQENGGSPDQVDPPGWDHDGESMPRGKHALGGQVKTWVEESPRTAEELDRALEEVREHARQHAAWQRAKGAAA